VHTIDYGAVYRALVDRLSKFEARNISEFACEAGLTCLDLEVCREVEIEVRLPKGHLQSEHIDGGGFTLRMVMKRTSTGNKDDITEAVLKTQLSCVIGVNPHEREAKQPIILTFSSPSHVFSEGGYPLLPLFQVS
jgi:dihydroneopterin aldolase